MSLSLFSVPDRDFTALDKQPSVLSKWLIIRSCISQPILTLSYSATKSLNRILGHFTLFAF